MRYKNTYNSYGIITKRLHALIAILFISQFVLVYWRDYFSDDKVFNIQLILLHKSIGFTLLFLGIFFVFWRLINIKPDYPNLMLRWEIILAKATQHSLYLIILLMPISGLVMSMMGGHGIKWFGYAVPNFLPINKSIASIAHETHEYLSYLIIFLFILHTMGALKHYFINKNNIVRRMWL